MKMMRILLVAILAQVIAGCSTVPNNQPQALQDRADFLYLRGSFTWWDIEEHAKVETVAEQVYRATVELVADGQPYQFKFADANWSLGANCGFYATKDEVLSLNDKVRSNCSAKFEPFSFTPKVTGYYDFYIDFTNEKAPKVWVTAAEPKSLIEKLVPSF